MAKFYSRSNVTVSTFAGDPVVGIDWLGDRYYTVTTLGRGRWFVEYGQQNWVLRTAELQRFFKPRALTGLNPIYQPDGEEVPVYEEVRIIRA